MSEQSRSNPIMSGVNTFVHFVTTSTESSGKAVQLLKPKEGGGYKMDRVAFQKLTEHPEVKNNEVGVISISGGMRDGKSFLLTLLTTYLESGEDLTCLKSKDSAIKRFFHWKSGVKSETRGVWIWNKPYMITKKDGQKLALILMDTQGSFDPNSSESDSAIFAFSTLLSSLQMYNLKERIKMNELESLAIFTRYAEMAGTKAAKGSCFQTLLLLVRDWQDDVAFKFGMDEEEGDKESYLQHVLRRYTGNDKNLKAVRDGITRAFKNVKCAFLPHPGMIISGHFKPDDGREDKGTLLMKDISEEFKNHVVIVFKTILLKYVEAKMAGDQVMTGTGLYNFAINLFQLLEDGKIQNPQSAMKALDVQAQTLLQKLEEKYDQEMEQISSSYCTEKELMERHEKKLVDVKKKYEDEFNSPYPGHKETYKTQLTNAIGPLIKKHKKIRLTNEVMLRVQYEELIEQIEVEYWKALNEEKRDGAIQAEEKFRHNNLNPDIYHKEYHDKLMECLAEANSRWERRKLLKENTLRKEYEELELDNCKKELGNLENELRKSKEQNKKLLVDLTSNKDVIRQLTEKTRQLEDLENKKNSDATHIPLEQIWAIPGQEGFLGEGSFGCVRLGYTKANGAVAIKIFKVTGSGREIKETHYKVMKEIRNLKLSNHANVIRLEGYTTWRGAAGIIMEYMPAGDLHFFLTACNNHTTGFNIPDIPADIRLRICVDVASGVAFLHHGFTDQRITHGDLKPHNILLTYDLRCKVGDFGGAQFATSTDEVQGISVGGKQEFTYCYASPQRLLNRTIRTSKAMDVYSVSMIYYEVLARKAPFRGSGLSRDDIVEHVARQRIRPSLNDVESLKGQSSTDDEEIISLIEDQMKKCWSHSPEERPSMIDVRDVFERVLAAKDIPSIMRHVANITQHMDISIPSCRQVQCVRIDEIPTGSATRR